MLDRFKSKGGTLPGGYEILRTLGTKGGCFNQGIYLVQHPTTRKVLICKTVAAGEAYSEIPAMHRLLGFPHIVQLEHFVLSSSEHKTSKLSKFQQGAMRFLHKLTPKPRVPTFSDPLDDFLPAESDNQGKKDFIYMEHCDLGSLADVMEKHVEAQQKIPESFLWHVFLGVAKALLACHTGLNRVHGWKSIVHCDIRPGNVLLASPIDGSEPALYPRVVLSDFGLAQMPARVVGGKKIYKWKEDVCKLGMLMEHLASCVQPKRPELDRRDPDYWEKVRARLHEDCANAYDVVRRSMKDYSEDFKCMVQLCKQVDSHRRFTCPDADELVDLLEALQGKVRAQEHGGKVLF